MVAPDLYAPLGQVGVNHPERYDPQGLVVQNHLALEVYGHRDQIHLVHQAQDQSDRQVPVAQVVHRVLVR